MINSIKIKHFRCYPKLTLKGLKRINVIVGANGSGKTALLESIFLASGGSPELGFRLQTFRGMSTGQEIPGDGIRALWQDLFFRFDQSEPIEIDLIDNTPGVKPRTLAVSLVDSEEMILPISEFEAGSGIVRNVPIEFVWTDASGVFRSRPAISDNGRIVFPSARNIGRSAFFPAQFRLNPEESAKRLSELNKREQLDGLRELISAVYSEITSLSVENHAGTWQVFAKLPMSPQRLPLALHSAGAQKFVAIALGIAAMEGGCVLIDEVENGFYYNRLEWIWKALYEVAREFRCQLFVTTHSQECLKAILPVLEEHEKEFALLKTSKEADEGRVFISEGEVMASAIREDFEVR